MANPYTPQTISGYNNSPPPDEGTQIDANRLKWSNHIAKIGDPLKDLAESINTAVNDAFATVDDASNLTRGILPDARLSPNIPRKNAANVFIAGQRFVARFESIQENSTASGNPATNEWRLLDDAGNTFARIGKLTSGSNVFNFTGGSGGDVVSAYEFDDAVPLRHGANSVATQETGSFTATLSGFTTTVQGTINWRRTGNLVTLWATSSILGTSNSSTMTMTGMDADVVPNNGKQIPTIIFDDSVDVAGAFFATSSGPFTFEVGVAGSSRVLMAPSAFTPTGSKGLPSGWTVTYSLDS